jgi:hypothetical protein
LESIQESLSNRELRKEWFKKGEEDAKLFLQTIF